MDKNLATEHVGAVRASWATRDSRQAGQSYILDRAYMQKTCDVAEKAILAKINLRKKCVNRDKM